MRRLKIGAWNIQGIISQTKNKLIDSDFVELMQSHDIIVLTETHADNQTFITLSGYKTYQFNRPRSAKAKCNSGGNSCSCKARTGREC
jgi:exonuclease III